MANFETLQVTARLRSGVICDEYLPLDGILFYQAMRERYGPRDYSLPGSNVGVEEIDPRRAVMPLALRFAERDRAQWWYACSFAHAADGNPRWWLAEGQDHWNKRFDNQLSDMVDFGKRRGKVIVEKGQYRAYHMPVYYRVASEIVWWLVGDKASVEHLLGTVTHVGKKQAQGWGRVAEWHVERVAEDWSCWRDGAPMRALPVQMHEPDKPPYNLRFYGLRPSYYARKNQMMVIVP